MNKTFSDLNLSDELLNGLSDLEFETPTDIQKEAIPYLLDNDNDFIGIAQTGTGKTAAFLIPLIEKINTESQTTQAIVLAPTRELAQQINNQLKALSKYIDIKSTCVFGGAPIQNQMKSLNKKPHIVVGTPGRTLDMLKRKALKLTDCEYFVLDEADEMLNMGFWEDIQIIFKSIKNLKQTLMFSATLPKPILNHIKTNFHPDFKKIQIEKKSLSSVNVKQIYYIVKNKFFKEALLRILESNTDIYGIIFCRTRLETKDLADYLRDNNHLIEVLNGDMGQKQRDSAMQKFKSKKVNIMVCTDVAARGIDVNNLTHVINFGIPQDNETYVHRIGRTARAGSSGTAITIACPKTAFVVKKIERFTKAPILLENLPRLETLKKNKIEMEVKKVSILADALIEEPTVLDEDKGYLHLEDQLSQCTRDQILKLFYKSHFQEKLKQYNAHNNIEVKVGAVDLAVHGKKPRRGRGSRGRGGGGRASGGRRGGRSGSGRSGGGGRASSGKSGGGRRSSSNKSSGSRTKSSR